MIILDLRHKESLSTFEILKILLHTIKICYIYKFNLMVQTHKKTIKLNSRIKRNNVTSKIIIIVKPYTRLIISNLESLLGELSKLNEPTFVITQVIYQHIDNEKQIVHFPKISKLLLKDLN